ncbi:MAG TPA: type I polyketide synthase [Polyangia bacterium]|jgi:acyl transferase domain-containing protein/acyl-CoA synthetase (AMP-forming)/AMP-acid ligase II/acyl carrier protein|nr:type I polyketide synthase [Polyangia bacterium]
MTDRTEASDSFTTILDCLRWRAVHQPEQTAYRFLVDGERAEESLTYQELDARARHGARVLAGHHVAGRPVLLCQPPGLQYIVDFFSCLYAGAIAVPAHEPEPRRAQRTLPRLLTMIEDARPAVALTSPATLANAATLGQDPILQKVPWTTIEPGTLGEGEGVPLPVPASPGTLAFLMYTSGSTGDPKGVEVRHANVMHNLTAFPGFRHRPCAGIVSWLPFYHDLGLFLGVLHPLYRGVPAALMSPLAFIQRPMRWLEAISRYRASATGGPNFAYDLCVRKSTPEQRAALDLRAWTLALNGAEPVRPETLKRFAEAFAPAGFRPEAAYPSYGLSDATATVTGPGEMGPAREYRLQPEGLKRGRVALGGAEDRDARVIVGCGQTIEGQRVVIVDPEKRTRCAPDEIGEIWVSGPSVAGGYWNRPEESEATFRARLAPGEDAGEGAFLRTGDLGFLDTRHGGELVVTGRLKDLIIIRGNNHYPQDVERSVELSHPALRAGCGVAFAVDVGSEERLVVVQEVEPAPGLDLSQVLEEIRQAIADGHGIEAYAIALVKPNSILKTSSGKPRRRACREQFLDKTLDPVAAWYNPAIAAAEKESSPAGDDGASVRGATSPAARAASRMEDWLLRRLSASLGVPAAELDAGKTFASYGLGSADAVQLAAALEAELGRKLPPTLLWLYPTVSELARHLAGDSAPSGIEVPPSVRPAEPVAIIGMACRFPQADSPAALWRLLAEGRDAVIEVPPSRWKNEDLYDPDPAAIGKTNTRWGGILDNVDLFDAPFFGISPREARHLDPRQRIMLELTWEALEDAGILPHTLAGGRTGVFAAVLSNDYSEILFSDLTRVDAYSGSGVANSIVSNRVSHFFDFRGPSLSVDTACSGSLVALHLACQSLADGESEVAVAGGVSVNLLPNGNVFFSKAGLIAPDGHCKTFSAAANGVVRSEGAGLVVLKRLSRAQADGDRIYAVIRGSAVNSDGRSNGLMAPNMTAQVAVLERAYQRAGISPAEVQYIEAHGTGTILGDPIETQALGMVLGPGRPPEFKCAIGSLKSNVGHMEPAAGIGGVMKVVLALQHRALPPSIHFDAPNPRIPFDSLPLRVQREYGPWPDERRPLVAGVSGFGFGGTNAHVVLSEAPPPRAVPRQEPVGGAWLLPLSARTPEALQALAGKYQRYLNEEASASLASVCYTASVHRTHQEHRLAVVGDSAAELAECLGAYQRQETRAGMTAGHHVARRRPRIAFVFSGQGSQWAGMGVALMAREPVFRAALERCDALIRQVGGWSLIEALRAEEGVSRLGETERAQAAILAIQVSLAELWQSWGISPDVIVGQSLGEVAAAHVAGALTLAEAVQVVHHRSRLMARTSGRGKTAVVGLPLEQARAALAGVEGVSIAGSNSPNETVLSGDPAALDELLKKFERDRVYCRAVRGVDIAFHSAQMEPLRPELVAALADLAPRPAVIPIYSSVTGERAEGASFDAAYWGRNLREPFLFAKTLGKMAAEGQDIYLEVSPHPVLGASLLDCLRHDKSEAQVVPSLRRGTDDVRQLLGSLGAVYAAGGDVAWSRVYFMGGSRAPLPAYAWQRERYWLDQLDGSAPAELSAKANGVHAGLRRSRPQRADVHPLLGASVNLASEPGRIAWECELALETHPYLKEHLVQGAVMFPGSGYVEMALAAARQAYGPDAFVEQADYKQALYLQKGRTYPLQLILSPLEEGRASFQIFSCAPADAQRQRWTLHAAGTVGYGQPAAAAAPSGSLVPGDIQGRCPAVMTGEEHYRIMGGWGFEYGPAFHAIEQIWHRDGEALARLSLPASLRAEAGPYQIHPVLLDSAFQVVSAALPEAERASGGGAYTPIPIGVGRTRIYAPPEPEMWCHVVLEDDPAAGSRRIEIQLMDEAGRVLAKVDGLRFRRMGEAARATAEKAEQAYELAWKPRQRSRVPGDHGDQGDRGTWVILGNGNGLGLRLAEQMQARGDRALLVQHGTEASFDVNDPGAFTRFLTERLGPGQPACRGVVVLWGLDAPGATGTGEADGAGLEAEIQRVMALSALMKALLPIPWERKPRLWLATRGAQQVQKNERPALSQAPLWGLARVIGHWEHPDTWGGIVDFSEGADVAEEAALLYTEMSLPDGEDLLAFRKGERYVARLAPRSAAASRPALQLRADASYLITGGLGELGLHVARWMATRGARRLILMGRSALPPRAEWDRAGQDDAIGRRIRAVREFEAQGISVHLAAVDAADRRQLTAWLDNYQRESWPPIRGVVHSAGTLQDQLLINVTPAALGAVLRPKLEASWNLHRYFERQPLDFFVLFSSAASVLGNMGQAAYAAGNAFVDALACDRQASGLPGLSIDWGPWSGGGMADGELEHMAKRGIYALAPDQGVQVLGELVAEKAGAQVAVLIADWAQVRAAAPGQRLPPLMTDLQAEAPEASAGRAVEVLRGLAPEGRQAWLIAELQKMVAGVIRLDPARLDPRMPLNSLGIDSIMAIELKNRIETGLGITVSLVDLLQDFTLTYFADRILAELKVELEADSQLADLLGDIDALSNQEAQDLLQMMQSGG